MRENKYDDPDFFERYSRMNRSVSGLEGAGEWHVLREMLPGFADRRVLDLGCGFGWHCQYAALQGASQVLGTDISEKMIAGARQRNRFEQVSYLCRAMEDLDFAAGSFDVVISSLAFHYIDSFREICGKVYGWLSSGGSFVFSVEHPVFTAEGRQDWIYGESGEPDFWPVDRYFDQGSRRASFLGAEVTKYHRTLATYISDLLEAGFHLTNVSEPEPDPALLDTVPGMRDELRRPIFLILRGDKF